VPALVDLHGELCVRPPGPYIPQHHIDRLYSGRQLTDIVHLYLDYDIALERKGLATLLIKWLPHSVSESRMLRTDLLAVGYRLDLAAE
jgi:hypothetical protein